MAKGNKYKQSFCLNSTAQGNNPKWSDYLKSFLMDAGPGLRLMSRRSRASLISPNELNNNGKGSPDRFRNDRTSG